MDTYLRYTLAGFVIFAAHVVSGVTGFGTNIVALPLLTLLVGIAEGRVAVVILSTLMYAVLSVYWRRSVNWRQLGLIVGVAGIGLYFGARFYAWLPERASILTLGIFVMLVGVQGLLSPQMLMRVPKAAAAVLLLLGGAVHGAFTIGGPLIVIFARRTLENKTVFRATLGVMWVVLNIFLMIGWSLNTTWPRDTLHITLVGLPFAILGMYAGEKLHHRVDPANFSLWVNALLIITGLMLATQALW